LGRRGDRRLGTGGDFKEALFDVFAGGVEEAEFFAGNAQGGGVLDAGFFGVGDVVGGVEAPKSGFADLESEAAFAEGGSGSFADGGVGWFGLAQRPEPSGTS
jgi:hypothetical protein